MSGRPAGGTAGPLLLLWGSVVAIALLGPERERLIPALAAYTAAFGALWILWTRHGHALDDPRLLLGGAVLLRLTLFPALPDLSDDLYRYVWDGWLLVSGTSPYAFVPSDPALGTFQADPLFQLLNSPDFRSVYPPVSQLVFAAGGAAYAWMGWPTAAFVVKAEFLALEVAGVFLLYRALRVLGLPPRLLVLYAWNPLVLLAVAGSGHTEGVLVLGLGLLTLGVASERPRTAWIGLALAVLSKAIPVVLAPLLLRHHLARLGSRRALAAPLPALVLGGMLALPFIWGGMLGALWSSADLYVRLFEFNAGPYFLAKEAAWALTGQDWSKWLGPAFRLVFLVAALLIWIRWPVASPPAFLGGCCLLFGIYLVTATTVHPWYLLWGLALVPFTPLGRSAWLWASWAAFPTYLTYVGVPHGPLAALFWTGVAVAVGAEAWPALRRRLLPWAGRRKARQIESHVEGTRILDLGAGEGHVGRALYEAGNGRRSVVLADPAGGFREPLPGVRCDGERLPFPDRSMDSVVLSLVLHHTADPDAVLAEALRVARGRVVVTESTFRFSWERALLERVDRWVNRGRGGMGASGDPDPLRFRTVPAWEEAIRHAGGRVVESRRLNRVGHRHHLLVVERVGSEPVRPLPQPGVR